MKILRRGLNLHGRVLSHRRGRPWLVSLHGFMQSGDAFSTALAGLSDRVSILAIDLAGHGGSDRCEDPSRFHAGELAADVLAWIDRLQLAPCFIHGYSLGGRLVWHLLDSEHRAGGGRIRGAVIESGHPGYPDAGERSDRLTRDAALADLMVADWDAFMRAWNSNPLLGPTNADPARARSYAACLRGFGTGTMEFHGAADLRQPVPVLVMAGEWDAEFVARLGNAAANRPDTTLAVIPEAGHRIWQDQPGAWTEAVGRFIGLHAIDSTPPPSTSSLTP